MRVHQTRHWDNAMPYTGTPRGWGHVLQREHIRVESIGKLHYRHEEDEVGFDKEHIPMHVVGGHGMVWASIRDPYLNKGPGSKRMLGERVGGGESPYTTYDRPSLSAQSRGSRKRQDIASGRSSSMSALSRRTFHWSRRKNSSRFIRSIEFRRRSCTRKPGYQRHPWVQAYADFMRNEDLFKSPRERLQAFAGYYGLVSFLDHNIGRIGQALREFGSRRRHDRHLHLRPRRQPRRARLWGKSTLYQEKRGRADDRRGPGVRPAYARRRSTCSTCSDHP
jgi:choline-sulfatase